ncbi:hypothetical protein [Chromobacterium vaccinii]|uniref:hypothetical protein n=1 Tax=Chromobacterium vaccinii TaxID=1108595 RepID=UPI001319FE17|nr:hypothetical protein [Chromobacterium vaccinii]
MSSPSHRKPSIASQDRLLPLSNRLLQTASCDLIGQANLKRLSAIHLIIGAVTALFGLPMLSMPLFPDVQNKPAAGILLSLFLGPLALVAAYAALRRWRHPPHHQLSLSDKALHYKTPSSWLLDGPSQESTIAWRDIVPATDGQPDVRTEFTTSKAITRDLVFWHRDAEGSVRMQRIPLRRFSRGTFLNGDELKLSLLLRLASRSDLRFAPSVFVSMRIDPASWRPMNKPMLAQGLGVLASMAVLFATLCHLDVSAGASSLLPLLATMLCCGAVCALLWHFLFPEWRHPIRFQPVEAGD